MKTDIAELARLIKLPATPTSVQWQVIKPKRAGAVGPDDWALAAVVELPVADARKLADATRVATVDPDFPRTFVLPWFPPELRALWSDTGGATLHLTAPARDGDIFYSAPLQSGFFVPFGKGGQVFVYLFTR